jgi:hypothetical protein
MSDSIIQFEECGKSQKIELAKEVLAGRKTISVIVDNSRRDLYAVTMGVRSWRLVGGHKSSPWEKFETGLYCPLFGGNKSDRNEARPLPEDKKERRRVENCLVYSSSITGYLASQGMLLASGYAEIYGPKDMAAGIIGKSFQDRITTHRAVNINGRYAEIIAFESVFNEENKLLVVPKLTRLPLAFTPLPVTVGISNYQHTIRTPEYAAIHAVYSEFWADGKSGGKKDEIVEWIIGNYGFSNKTADVIDTICRPENRRKGGNVKLKAINPKSQK